MQTQTTRRPNRTASPARWQTAAQRAVAEGVQIRQLQSTGEWIATSGSDASLAYLVEVTGAIAHGCDCLAGLNGDPVCKHRAAYYLLTGALSLDPEPEPPAPAITLVRQRGSRFAVQADGTDYGYTVLDHNARRWVLFAGEQLVGSYRSLDELQRAPLPRIVPLAA